MQRTFVAPTKDREQIELIKEAYKIWEEHMFDLGFKVQHYQGRFYYDGPAIHVIGNEECAKVIYLSPFKTQVDEDGKNGWVIYPAFSFYPSETILKLDLNLMEDFNDAFTRRNKNSK